MEDSFLLEAIKAFIGTMTGALVAIVTIWLGERAGRRRVVKEWFDNTFLFHSIEPLLHKSRYIVTNIVIGRKEMPETFDTRTISQTQRINQLLRDDTFGRLWAMASDYLSSKEFTEAKSLFHGLSVSLRDLQDAVLETTITNRRDIFTLCNTPRYKRVVEGLEKGEKDLETYGHGSQKTKWREPKASEKKHSSTETSIIVKSAIIIVGLVHLLMRHPKT